jgi:membrane protein DedA with SNARE-associated domain
VETGKSGDGPVYTCRLCGATLYGKGATIQITRMWQHWFFALAFLGMSASVFIVEVLPSLSGQLYHSPIRRDESPVSYWAFMLLFVGFSAVTLAVSIWQFRCIWRKMRGENHVA